MSSDRFIPKEKTLTVNGLSLVGSGHPLLRILSQKRMSTNTQRLGVGWRKKKFQLMRRCCASLFFSFFRCVLPMKTNDFCRTCGCTRSEKESRTPPGITTTTTTTLNNERCRLLRNWPSGERKKKENKTKIKTTDKTDKKDMRCTVFSPAAFSSL